jgi:peptidoglycan/LPS O-acetylase OafA/YrhL
MDAGFAIGLVMGWPLARLGSPVWLMLLSLLSVACALPVLGLVQSGSTVPAGWGVLVGALAHLVMMQIIRQRRETHE